ncbi:MAG TPA: carboxypeptidase-like regulatory domain-containing protein [Gemmatimonadaceae bacterium]
MTTKRIKALLVFGMMITGGHIAHSQTLTGRITQRATGEPVPRARVVLMDLNDRAKSVTSSDSGGTYRIQAPLGGSYKLIVHANGFASVNTPPIELAVGVTTTLDINVPITDSATTIAPVTVTAEKPLVSAPPGNPHKYDEFLRRRQLGIGTFLTREQIEATPHSQTPEIFSHIAGLKVRQHGTEWYIQSQRCPARLGTGREQETMDDPNPWLYPMLFVDGHRMRDLKFITTISPSQIEAIEVYQGAAQLPADAKGNACAAIYVWLKN